MQAVNTIDINGSEKLIGVGEDGLTAQFFRDLLCGGIHAIEEHGGAVMPRRMQVGTSQTSQEIFERHENISSIQEVMNPRPGDEEERQRLRRCQNQWGT